MDTSGGMFYVAGRVARDLEVYECTQFVDALGRSSGLVVMVVSVHESMKRPSTMVTTGLVVTVKTSSRTRQWRRFSRASPTRCPSLQSSARAGGRGRCRDGDGDAQQVLAHLA